MTTVDDLPNEILCDIFSLAIQRSHAAPQIFKSGDDFRDCAALIEISRVCRRWREAALAESLLWSSFCILLHEPTAESLRQATRYASICFGRSRDAPLTCFVSISKLDDLRLAHPLMLALVAHEDRWSRIAIEITRGQETRTSRVLHSLAAEEDFEKVFDVSIKTAGKGFLKEFHFNIGSWFIYSMSDPLPSLETLRIAGYKTNDMAHTLSMWLPLAPNLVELDIASDHIRFSLLTFAQMKSKEALDNQNFVLPKLTTLRATPYLLSNLTCPALESYAIGYLPVTVAALDCFRRFIERSAPPLHVLEVKCAGMFVDFETARGYFHPGITTLSVTAPKFMFFNMLTEKSPSGNVHRILPSLENLQLSECSDRDITHIFFLITSRWSMAQPEHSLKSVKLTQWSGPIPKFLSIKPSSRIKLKKVNSKWREIARCMKEGLQFSIE
ncbi:hypothetical protein SCHPADRAFT_893658 [Schizopora paradoxa]|uniref:F-box domain-containing protein n=1 Tax=Schizopora paradoxa TaxID=27342 RepID=A0A0H2RGQ7_9AGAM|nr:hypothetical protein SCHPADRAFT_893658 [Schizopora paradoxa]